MALIKRADTGNLLRSALVLDLGDLRKQGEALIQQAQARAQRVVQEGHAERQNLISTAAADGRAEGLAEGLAEGHRLGVQQGREAALAEHAGKLEQVTASWSAALDEFVSQRDSALAEARRDVVRLAIRIAEKVIKRAVTVDPGIAAAQIEAVLGLVLGQTRLVVRVHPEDRGTVEAALPKVLERCRNAAHIELVNDPVVGRGGCIVRCTESSGEIDASLDVQLERIAEALMPSREATDPNVRQAQAGDQP